VSVATRVPLPTVSKILKALAHAGVLVSHRGVGGGFALARPAEAISVGAVIEALEGPIALTECLGDDPHSCDIEAGCPVRSNWERINRVVRDALEGLSIADMASARFSLRSPVAATPSGGPSEAR
jgi:Rrf2 family protein